MVHGGEVSGRSQRRRSTRAWRSEDVDGDERPDLMLDPDNTLTDSDYPRHTSLMPDGWRLAHSLPDGTFSTSDVVATSFVGSAAELTRP